MFEYEKDFVCRAGDGLRRRLGGRKGSGRGNWRFPEQNWHSCLI